MLALQWTHEKIILLITINKKNKIKYLSVTDALKVPSNDGSAISLNIALDYLLNFDQIE
jgi:hypothetical protein